MKFLAGIRRFSPGLGHYLFGAVLFLRLVALERLSRSGLLLPGRGDMHFYNEWAQRILRGEPVDHGAFYGLPLYPYLLALSYRIFGYNPLIPGFVQALFDAGTAFLIYKLSFRLFSHERSPGPDTEQANHPSGVALSKTFAAIAALAWGIYVPAEAYSIILMPTAAFIFVFWLIVWRIVKAEKVPSWKECLVLGFLIGIAAMAVATSLFLVPLVLAALFQKPGTTTRKTACVGAAALLVAVALGTSPCWIHNFFVARDPVFLSAHGGVNFWIGNNPTANGYPRFPPGLRAGQAAMLEDSINSAETALGRSLKKSEVSAYWSNQAKNYIAHHLGDWLELLLVKIRNFWSAFQYDDLSIITNLREQGVVPPGLYFGLIAALGLPGMLFAWRLAPASRWIIAAVILQMIALLTVFVTERYRLPIVPGLLVLAVFGLSILWRSLRSGGCQRASAYVALLVCSSAFVAWPQGNPSLWALDAYNSGWQALESGNLALAERKLVLARDYVPTNPEINFALGNLQWAKGNNKAAGAFYLTTLQYDENHRGALNNLGVIALDANRYQLAEMWLRRAERLDDRNAKTHFLLAKALLAQGDHHSAELEAECAIRLSPNQNEFRQLGQQLKNGSN